MQSHSRMNDLHGMESIQPLQGRKQHPAFIPRVREARPWASRCNTFGVKSPGFTLVELLVVIAIIIVLIGLLLPAVMMVKAKTLQARNKSDINQLCLAVEEFHLVHGFYPPSRLTLREQVEIGLSAPIYPIDPITETESVHFLKKMFPRIGATVDWNNDGDTTDAWTLRGDQCLVFFLGGPAQVGTVDVHGFSTNPANPAQLGGTRRSPFYDFPRNRLKDFRGYGCFPSYLDNLKVRPYAYFSSWFIRQGYNKHPGYECRDNPGNAFGLDNINQAVWPYARGQGDYMNPQSYQIICAGSDMKFGMGTIHGELSTGTGWWTPYTTSSILQNGRDDLSNFYDKRLGD